MYGRRKKLNKPKKKQNIKKPFISEENKEKIKDVKTLFETDEEKEEKEMREKKKKIMKDSLKVE